MSYFLDPARKHRWIIPPKCASSSISRAVSLQLGDEDWYTIGVVRHPWDRLASALWSYCYDGGRESPMARYRRYYDDPHVATQAPYFRGQRVDRLIPFESLRESWAELQREFGLGQLPHDNRGREKPADLQMDWASLLPRYQEDFDLWPSWKS